MLQKLYIISPFELSSYPWCWKTFFWVELFSALAKRGYYIYWISPGKFTSMRLFPFFFRYRNMTVVQFGSPCVYRLFIPFFIKRLQHVKPKDELIVFIEGVVENPLPIDLDDKTIVIPIIFSLQEKWILAEDNPTPLIVPIPFVQDYLTARRINPSYLQCLTMGYEPLTIMHNQSTVSTDGINLILMDKRKEFKGLCQQIQSQLKINPIYISPSNTSFHPYKSFCDFFRNTKDTWRPTLICLSKDVVHFAPSCIASQWKVIIPKDNFLRIQPDNTQIFGYSNENADTEVFDLICEIIKHPYRIGSSSSEEKLNQFLPWDSLAKQMEEIVQTQWSKMKKV